VEARDRGIGLENDGTVGLASSFRRFSLRLERAACLRSSAGLVSESGGFVFGDKDAPLR